MYADFGHTGNQPEEFVYAKKWKTNRYFATKNLLN